MSPDQPEVFDIVTVTVEVQSNGTVPVTELTWDFGDEWGGRTMLNMTGTFEATLSHMYTHPETYHVQVRMRDALNCTAGDVESVKVSRQTTVLTLDAYPDWINTTDPTRDYFTLDAHLTTRADSPVRDAEVAFYYANWNATETDWLPIRAEMTRQDGRAVTFFKPAFEGLYKLRAVYEGDNLHAPAEVEYGDRAVVTPEFSCQTVVAFLAFLIAGVGAKMRRKT